MSKTQPEVCADDKKEEFAIPRPLVRRIQNAAAARKMDPVRYLYEVVDVDAAEARSTEIFANFEREAQLAADPGDIHRQKLTPAMRQRVRALAASGEMTVKAIAERMGVGHSTIHRALGGQVVEIEDAEL